eukprot:1159868-Pelagomonas_calceolata.AAC.6
MRSWTTWMKTAVMMMRVYKVGTPVKVVQEGDPNKSGLETSNDDDVDDDDDDDDDDGLHIESSGSRENGLKVKNRIRQSFKAREQG